MKKIIISLLLVVAPISLLAQFKVKSDGTSLAGSGYYRQNSFSNAKVNMESYTYLANGQDLIGLQGCALMNASTSTNKAVGVFGIAGNASDGHNFGVAGYLAGSKKGAAVFGSIYDDMGITLHEMYAGYFNGVLYATGAAYASSFNTTADLRLKKNVVSAKDNEGDYRFLDRVMDMNVIEYNLIDHVNGEKSRDGKNVSIEDQRHIGLAAQELQELFPDLVVEGQDGYLAVNYVELVPVLIRSIQELKEELDAVKGVKGTEEAQKAPSASGIDNSKASAKNVLYQNTPNPFKEQTVIRFRLADDAQNAAICIFDMTGKTIKKLPISSGMESVSIGGYELGEGMFLYSLIVNGQEIDTKKMVILK